MNRTPIPRQSKKRLAEITAGTYRPKAKKALKRTALKKKRRVTGERALFVRLYEERGGVSEVSGKELLPPDSERFHYQGSHILPKGTYPELRLNPDNIAMITADEHSLWHQFGAEGLRYSHGWQGIVGRYDELKRRANGITV